MSEQKDLSQPVAFKALTAGCITCDGPKDFTMEFTEERPAAWQFEEGRIREFMELYAGSYVDELRQRMASMDKIHEETMSKLVCANAKIHSLEAEVIALSGRATGDAAKDVVSERDRQINYEFFLPRGDDKYVNGELAKAAAAYAVNNVTESVTPMLWPWQPEGFKTSTHRRNLVKAGALILAEIERIDRIYDRANDGGSVPE